MRVPRQGKKPAALCGARSTLRPFCAGLLRTHDCEQVTRYARRASRPRDPGERFAWTLSLPLVQFGGSGGTVYVLLRMVRGRVETSQRSRPSADPGISTRPRNLRRMRNRLRCGTPACEEAARRSAEKGSCRLGNAREKNVVGCGSYRCCCRRGWRVGSVPIFV